MPDDEPDRNAHSPQLDERVRSRERAALDIACRELTSVRRWAEQVGMTRVADGIREALDKIAALVPDAVK